MLAFFFALTLSSLPLCVTGSKLEDSTNNSPNEIAHGNQEPAKDSAHDPEEISIPVINEDYWASSFEGYNEDADLNFTELTNKYEYPTETHTVTTDDAYILTIFRIKGKNCNGTVKTIPLVIMHGLMDTSDSFIITTPAYALAYLLADKCYDVWLPNQRGNRYSRKHVYYTTDKHSEKYWNFTFEEHGKYDLKAVVDYVLDTTDSQKLSYIGHSQGNTDFYVLASTYPEYNKKITLTIALAPIAWVYNLKSPLFRILAYFIKGIKTVLDLSNTREVFSRDDPGDMITELLCQFLPYTLCGARMLIMGGGDPKEIGRKNLQALSGHFPDSAAVKNFVHFAQEVKVDRFQKYDYEEKNLQIYGAVDPPEYDVSKVTAPVALIASKGDLLSTIKDVSKLRDNLPNVVHYSEMGEEWGHGHYTFSKEVPTKLAPEILELLAKYGS